MESQRKCGQMSETMSYNEFSDEDKFSHNKEKHSDNMRKGHDSFVRIVHYDCNTARRS
jgi:hypothetical protein